MLNFINSVLSILAVLGLAFASPVADPAITPPPLVQRDDQAFVGYYLEGVYGTYTSWTDGECNAGYTFTTAQNYYRCCDGACNMFTGCSGNLLLGAATTVNCLTISEASCVYDLLYPSQGAVNPQTYPYCVGLDEVGTNLYRQSPEATSSSSSSSSAVSSSLSLSSSPVISSAAASSGPSKTPIGAIVGGAVGGLAVLALFVLGILLLLKKNRRAREAETSQPEVSAAPLPPPASQVAYNVSSKPVVETKVNPVSSSPSSYASPAPRYEAYQAPEVVQLPPTMLQPMAELATPVNSHPQQYGMNRSA